MNPIERCLKGKIPVFPGENYLVSAKRKTVGIMRGTAGRTNQPHTILYDPGNRRVSICQRSFYKIDVSDS
jgi:hypothetical protein